MQWTGDDFRFLSALTKIEEFAKTLPEEDQALVLQDTCEWKKHWNYYVRSEPVGFIAFPLSSAKWLSVQHNSLKKTDWLCLRFIRQKDWSLTSYS